MNKYVLDYDGTLGQFVKFWRKAKKINSKELSKEIGRSDSYVSHLENDRYKNPDYETMYEIFKRIGIKEEKIEDYLFHFNIISPEREAWEEQQAIASMQPPTEEDWKHMQDEAEFWEQHMDKEIHNNEVNKVYQNYTDGNSEHLIEDIITENVKNIIYTLNNIKDHDTNDSYDLIIGLSNVFDELSTNAELYKFMSKFFSKKLSSLDNKGMIEVINALYKELNRIEKEKNVFGKPKEIKMIKSL